MNSPYMGKFKVSQKYKGITHDGLDLVGIDSKEIHSTINGTVLSAGWENASNHKQGFGQFVKIKQDGSPNVHYFGHLSKICVTVGQHVNVTQVIGIEGSTGCSTGSHCHYCIRLNGIYGNQIDVSQWTGIPNHEYCTYDDGYRRKESNQKEVSYTVKNGDSWWSIAQNQCGNGCLYERLAMYNGKTSKNVIKAGQVIKIPKI